MVKLRDEHLNEERKLLSEVRFEYQDVFYLPGEKLSCTNAARHTIQLEQGVTPINTRPYRLPESQEKEIDKQVKQLVEDGIITESDYPWNSPLLIVPKRAGPDGKPKWRLVVDFRQLNEKTVGDAHPLPDITEVLDQLGQSKYFTCLDMVMGYHQIKLDRRLYSIGRANIERCDYVTLGLDVSQGNKLFFPVRHVLGVSFYVNSRLFTKHPTFEPINDRLCWIRVHGKFSILQRY